MRISLFPNNEKIDKKDIDFVLKKIKDAGHVLDDFKPEIVIFFGGDGTFLKAVHQYNDILDSVKFIGLMKGQLGFFYEYNFSEIDTLLADIKAGRYLTNKFNLLEATLIENDKEEIVYAVNEIRIENPFKTLVCDVKINNIGFETFRGNGLVVSSTLGSSAYNKSLSGALVDHDLKVLELTEIATIQTNIHRSLGSSLILSGNKTISFATDYKNVVIGYDRETINNGSIKEIKIKQSKKEIQLLRKNQNSYLNSLKKSFIE